MTLEKISELEARLKECREAYYNDNPLVEDDVYDALEDELRRLDPDNDLLTSVGAAPSGKTKWSKMRHQMAMTSLNKVNSITALRDWFASVSTTLQPTKVPASGLLSWSEKLDGISISLNYENGNLVSAITRGDGFVGEDILANVVMMRGVKRKLPHALTGSIRGEIVLTHDMWRTHFPDYANPRNAAAGIAKRESRDKAQGCQHLTVMCYDVASRGLEFEDDEEKFFFIKTELGLKVPNHGFGRAGLETIYQEYENTLRDELNYDIDGLVIRLQKSTHFKRAGERSGNPYGAVALKFAAEGAITTLRNVVWQTGNTGRITPVAEFDPVDLAGAEVRRASLYNSSYIREMNLNIDDQIMVKRANDVIPRVEKLISKKSVGYLTAPTQCPSCGSKTKSEGEYVVCTGGTVCPASAAGRIKQWIESISILEWGDFIIEEVVKQGLVEDVDDLYRLSVSDLKDLQKSNGAVVGRSTATSLIEQLVKNSEVTLDALIGGLGIEGIRNRTVQKFMQAGYDTVDKLTTAYATELTYIDGIGEATALAFTKGIKDREPVLRQLLDRNYVTIKKREGNLKGKRITLTGALSKPRAHIKRDIQDAGGTVKGMAQSTDYLVAADPNTSSSKAAKARKYGVPIISENELYNMM